MANDTQSNEGNQSETRLLAAGRKLAGGVTVLSIIWLLIFAIVRFVLYMSGYKLPPFFDWVDSIINFWGSLGAITICALLYIAAALSSFPKMLKETQEAKAAIEKVGQDSVEAMRNVGQDSVAAMRNVGQDFLSHLSKIESTLAEDMSHFSNRLEQIEKAGIKTLEICIDFLNRILKETVLNPTEWVDLAKQCPSRVQEAIKSIGINLSAWSKNIAEHRDIEKGKDMPLPAKSAYLTSVWLTYLETYAREEAFDIRRKELVTNGRNYPFLLIATLSTLLDQLPKGYYLHYYAVTPVNPKDWYNWPHGRTVPKCYCEASFLSLFHRSLQEFLLLEKQNQNRLINARFILASNSDASRGAFGWPLDSFLNLREDLLQCRLINIAAPINAFEEGDAVWRAFNDYYKVVTDPLQRTTEEMLIVPLYGTHWARRLDEMKLPGTERYIALKKSVNRILKSFEESKVDIKRGLALSKIAADNTLKYYLNKLTPNFKGKVEEYVSKCKDGDWSLCDFAGLVKYLHEISLEEALNAKCEEDIVKEILLALLRYRAAVFHNISTSQFDRLGEVFAKQLHSDPQNAFVSCLSSNKLDRPLVKSELCPFDVEYWMDIEPEFAIFGISKDNKCDAQNFDEIEWKLALATDISYPFEAAKIRIIDRKDAIRKYKDTLGTLLRGLDAKKTLRIMDLLNEK